MNHHAEILPELRESPVIVFVNSAAGGGRARAYLPRLQSLFESLKIRAQFVITSSAEELELSARNAISEDQRVFFAMGGDGTFQALANASFETDALLGVLPVGGGNDFAAGLGLPGDPIRAAEAVLQGRPRLVDLVRARTADGKTRLYVGGGGVGLDAEAARYAGGVYRHFPGRFRYIAAALRALAGYKPLDVQIDFPGSGLASIKTKALLAAVLSSATYGGGLRLAPDAKLDDGSLHVVLVEDLTLLEILKLLPRLMRTGELRTSRVKRWRVQRLRLMTDRPSVFHGDGEILGPTPVEIEVVPRGMRVLAPQPR